MERKNNMANIIDLSDKAQVIFWANIWDTVSQINKMASIEEFYGNIVPVDHGNKEVYERLRGWKKEAYKDFILSGSFVISRFGDKTYLNAWGYGRLRTPGTIPVTIQEYEESATDWADYIEVHEEWSWEEVCKHF